MHGHFWSDNEIQAFGRFVDTNDNKLTHFKISTYNDIFHHLDDILRHVYRMTNIKVFNFVVNFLEQIQPQSLKNLLPICKKLKKVKLSITIDDFDLWQTFRQFDELKELNISYSSGIGSVLIRVLLKPRYHS